MAPPAKINPPSAKPAPKATNTSPEAVRAEVRRLAAEVLKVKPEKLDLSLPLQSKEIGADDLDMAEITMAIEDAFDITIREEEMGKSLKPLAEISVDEFARYVGVQLKAKEASKSDRSPPQEVKAFDRPKVHIAVGMTKAEVRRAAANARDFHEGSGKHYSFKPVPDEVYARDSWSLTYGPEVPGMGRVDTLDLTFQGERLTRIVVTTMFCP